jgi:hypothetical protein
LTYEGSGQITVTGRAANIRHRPGKIWFDYSPGEGSVGVSIRSTDPRDSGNYIRNIRVMRIDHVPLAELGAIFNPHWLNVISDFRVLRFMDWMNTNGSMQKVWSDRPVQSDYTYQRRGVPIEVLIALSTRTSADMWVNLPHMADNDYVSAFANLVANTLHQDRKVYVEYSNEVWNWIFPQANWMVQQAANAFGSENDDSGFIQFAGLRAAKVADIWRSAFSDERDQLVNVIATQAGWPGLEAPLLEAPLSTIRPADGFDAYAVTGYFHFPEIWLSDPSQLRQILDESAAKDPSDRFADAIAKASDAIAKTDIARLTNEVFPYHAEVANAYGLDLIMYEGGTHVVGTGALVNDQAITDFLIEFNYSAEMAGLYSLLLDGWYAAGGVNRRVKRDQVAA